MPKGLRLRLLCGALMAAAFGCGSGTNVEKIPVGTEVQLTRQDGGVVQGRLADRDADVVRVMQGSVNRSVARRDIVDIRIVDQDGERPALPLLAKFREFRVPEGTELNVQLDSAVASDTSRSEDPVQATLTAPISVGGIEVLPAGTIVEGYVTAAHPSGNVKGRALLAIRFGSVLSRGEKYPIAARVERMARATKGEDAEKIGIPAAGGAIIGALVGGKKGAAVGTAVGAGAGTAVVLTTSGPEIRWPRGTRLAVQLDRALDVRVPIRRSS